MPGYKSRFLLGDQRTTEFRDWSTWMKAVAKFCDRHATWEEDPFQYNETASVGALASAAAMGGFTSLVEYGTDKYSKTDRRTYAAGRSDLWVAGAERCWTFECKQIFLYSNSMAGVVQKYDAARTDALHTYRHESDKRVGCLILSTRFVEEGQAEVNQKCRDFMPEQTDLAHSKKYADANRFSWEVSEFAGREATADAPATFFYFSVV